MARFIDSHAHLADPAFREDRDAVLARARATGALAIVCIGESLAQAAAAREIAHANPGFVTHTAGVHPHDAAEFDASRDLDGIRTELGHGAVAIGECGLDYHYDHSPRVQQRRAFMAQLALARDVARPVIVHTREAVEDTKAIVADAGADGIVGVLHCFTGPVDLAEVALAAGWYVSFAGIVTFRKWTDDALIRSVPDDRLLIETDAPYLAPVPHRGKRNEPAYLSLTLAHVAAARGVDVESLGRSTARNAVHFFDLAIASDGA
jgi:TatD DNase family protein